MRNYRDLSEDEIKEIGELFPYTPNRELSAKFDISPDTLRKKIAKPRGWVKTATSHQMASKVVLTEKQEQWIIRHFKHTRNSDIVQKFGIGESTLRRLAVKHGLKKSARYLAKTRELNVAKSVVIMKQYGVLEENRERAKLQWEERKATGKPHNVGFQKGVTHKDRLSKKKYEQLLVNMSNSRKELIRKERMRIKWGLEQKTNINVFSGGRQRVWKRTYFRRRGYIVERADNYVYYTDETNRNIEAEKKAHEVGLKVLPYKEAI